MQRGARGIATVEFALIAPFLLFLLAGVLDFAMLLRTATCAADAARAGTEYGSQSATAAADTAGIQAAALNAAPGVAGMSAVATRSCQCSDGSAINCGSACVTGKMTIYEQATTQVAAHTVFDYSALNFSNSVSAKATMRAQ